jgi:hypothetical protein
MLEARHRIFFTSLLFLFLSGCGYDLPGCDSASSRKTLTQDLIQVNGLEDVLSLESFEEVTTDRQGRTRSCKVGVGPSSELAGRYQTYRERTLHAGGEANPVEKIGLAIMGAVLPPNLDRQIVNFNFHPDPSNQKTYVLEVQPDDAAAVRALGIGYRTVQALMSKTSEGDPE